MLRSTPLFTVVLLAVCCVANAPSSAQVTETTPRVANPPAQIDGKIFPDWSTSCANVSSATKQPIFIPAPEERATLPCGPCSVPACRGMNLGDTCGIIGGTVVKCAQANFCGSGPGTGRFCDCTTPLD